MGPKRHFKIGWKRLARDKHSGLLGPLINYEENEVFYKWPLGSCSQYFIFFVSFRPKKLRINRLVRLARDKYSGLLGPFISYEENEVFYIWTMGSCSQHFIYFVTY
jgi:hypothetical protein